MNACIGQKCEIDIKLKSLTKSQSICVSIWITESRDNGHIYLSLIESEKFTILQPAIV